MNYEDLLIEADRAGLIVKEKPLLLSDGRIKGRKIAIRKNTPTLRKKAECLEVSEDFLKEALECSREKYGCYTELDGYLIMFEPYLAVIEKI